MAKIAIVVPVRSTEKHPSNPIATEQRFMNFGSLALATFCERNGHSSIVVDEYVLKHEQDSSDVIAEFLGPTEVAVIGISCISAYSADRAKFLAAELRAKFPRAVIALGGQHFAGLWGNKFSNKIPDADVLVAGEAENATKQILDLIERGIPMDEWKPAQLPQNLFWKSNGSITSGNAPPTVVSMDEIAVANYSLYPGSCGLFPSIEFSRGCKFACVFCANTSANRRNFRHVSLPSLFLAVEALQRQSNRHPIQFYLQASDFVVPLEKAKDLQTGFARMDFKTAWRTEIRVDEIEPETLRLLADCGMTFLDMGLESASPSMLRIMNKTKNPAQYLERAENLLQVADEVGIFAKVNFLIHPGDTVETVSESRNWLMERKQLIKGISSGVTLEYPGTPLSNRLGEFSQKYGTRRRAHDLQHWGVYQLDPSASLSLEEAELLARQISQTLQTRENFARSKSFGYTGVNPDPELLILDLPEADHTTPYR